LKFTHQKQQVFSNRTLEEHPSGVLLFGGPKLRIGGREGRIFPFEWKGGGTTQESVKVKLWLVVSRKAS